MKRSSLIAILILSLMIVVPSSASIVESDEFQFTNYYDQLDENGKACYDACVNELTPDNLRVELSLPHPFATKESNTSSDYLRDLYREMRIEAMKAMEMDLPMAFWMWQGSIIHYSYDEGSSGDMVYIEDITIEVRMASAYADDPVTKDVNELELKINELKTAVDKFQASSSDPTKIIVTIQNPLKNNFRLSFESCH